MDMRQVVGRNFGRLRRAKGLTQEEDEARPGISQCRERLPLVVLRPIPVSNAAAHSA